MSAACRAATLAASPRTADALMPAAVLASFIALSAQAGLFFDGDMYFLVATGRDIIANGLSTTDPLSSHEGLPYLSQQWLTCVVDAAAYDAFGRAGVEGIYMALTAASAALLWKASARYAGKKALGLRAGLLVAAACVPSMLMTRSTPRAFDAIALTACLLSAATYLDGGQRRALAAVPACSLALANLHGSMWTVALMPAACALLDWRAKGKRAPLLTALAAGALAACANPYGPGMLTYVFASLSAPALSAFGIGELSPASANTFAGWPALAMPAAFWWMRRGYPGPSPDPRKRWRVRMEDALLVGLWAGSLASVRVCFLLYTAAAMVLSSAVEARPPAALARPSGAMLAVNAATAATLACTLAACALSTHPQADATEKQAGQAACVQALEDASVEPGARGYASFNEGAYLEFMGYRPYMDARAELWCPEVNGGDDIAGEFLDMRAGKIPLSELLARHDFEFAVISADEQDYDTARQMEIAGMDEAYRSDLYAVWVRREG